MVYQIVDGVRFKMREEYDFSFLRKYGKVFKVFDDQDSGNICFGMDDGGKKVFVKFAGAKTAEYEGDTTDAIERLKSTQDIYQNIRHPGLIRLLSAEEIGGGFAMVFEWTDGKCMGRMYEEDHREIMALPVSDKLEIFAWITDFLQAVAWQGFVAIDFYDGSILYDTRTKTTRICDIDFFAKKPYINEMGRMWGSTRFMAPEEYEKGAVIDEVTNVFTLGQMAFSLFTDSDHERAKWPLSEECYQVILKATAPRREDRFQTIEDFQIRWLRCFRNSSRR